MPQTRASARLAKVAKTEPPDNKELTSPPKRKRAKTNHPTKNTTTPHTPHLRGKRSRLANFMNLPADLFTEIALYLVPKDIISLSRLNRSLRSVLMRRSARHIWCGAMRNVPGLPPCPADMIEPRYLAMIYAHNCMMCGVATTQRMDEVLRTRLCIPCAKEAVLNIRAVPSEVASLVLCSYAILPIEYSLLEDWALRFDVEYVQNKLKELDDPQAREAWKEERQQLLGEHRKQAGVLREFTDRIGRECRTDIETRLLKEAWDRADLKFWGRLQEDWIELVEQPEPLTDQLWETLKPKLIPLLEANRVVQLQRERERIEGNRGDLEDRMQELNDEANPIVKATIYRPVTTSGLPLKPATERLKYRGIFPDIMDVLEWDETKVLLEADLAWNDFPEECVWDAMAPFNSRVWSWIEDIEAKLVDMLRKGRVNDGFLSNIPNPSLPLVDESDDPEDDEQSDEEEPSDDPFEHASDNQKILLRADSLFQSTRNGAPVTYEELVETAYATGSRKGVFDLMEPYKTAPLDTSKFQRHAAGQAQARKILEWMGRPDATFLEMKSVGSAYTCGRCPDGYAHSWEGIADHFVSQANNWKRIGNGREELAKRGVTFRDVHDPAWEIDKLLVRILSKPERDQIKKSGRKMEECWLCSQVEPEITTLGLQHKIREHIKDMHDISTPKYHVHYGPWAE